MYMLPYSLFEPKVMTQPQHQQLNLFGFVNEEPTKKTRTKKQKFNPPINDRTNYEDGLIGG